MSFESKCDIIHHMIWIVYDNERIKKNRDFVDMLKKLFAEDNIKTKLVFAENIKRYKQFPKVAIMRTDIFETSKFLESHNVKTCNNSKIAEICNDKYKTYQYLKENGVDVVDTQEYTTDAKLSYPVVVKSKFGHGGSEVYLINNQQELCRLADRYNKNSLIIQPLVDAGKDKRTYVINNKPVISMLRTSKVDFRSNFSLGGKAEKSDLTKEEKALIDKVLKLFHFDFAGIDIIYKNGKPYINEIEDVVGSRMVYQHTNYDIIKDYVKHIKNIYKGILK